MIGFSAQGIKVWYQVSATVSCLVEALGKGSTFKFIQVVGGIQCLAVVGLRSLFSFWLSSGGYLQLLVATPFIVIRPLQFRLAMVNLSGVKSLSCFEYFCSGKAEFL